jgi:hypothetical protein
MSPVLVQQRPGVALKRMQKRQQKIVKRRRRPQLAERRKNVAFVKRKATIELNVH